MDKLTRRVVIRTFVYLAILASFMIGLVLYIEPYVLVGNRVVHATTLEYEEDDLKFMALWKLSSKGFLSTHYPVEVSLDMIVMNSSLLPILAAMSYIELTILNTYSYPIEYSELGQIIQGSIRLQLLQNATVHEKVIVPFILRGKNDVVFTLLGNDYPFAIAGYYEEGYLPYPIYATNLTDFEERAPYLFQIEETYSSRIQFENSNRRIGLAISALAVSSAGVMLRIGQIQSGKIVKHGSARDQREG